MACLRSLTAKEAADWVSENPWLGFGVMGVESDTGKCKVNFASVPTRWNSLDYFDPSGSGGNVKVYRALLTQSGTDAPLATVLENSLGGEVVWTRTSTGKYVGTLAGAFTANTWIPIPAWCGQDAQSLPASIAFFRNDGDTVHLETGTGGDFADEVFPTPMAIEILVYPS